VWPDNTLGSLGPQDNRFPLPGRIGVCLTAHNLVEIPRPRDPEAEDKIRKFEEQQAVTDRLPLPIAQHQEDVCEQFLTTVEEMEVTWQDDGSCGPGPADTMEYRAHACPKMLKTDFQELFPKMDLSNTNLTIVLCSLKAATDQATWSTLVEAEREKLMENFIQGATEVCMTFEEEGFWADFIDPFSGKPYKAPHTNFTMFETDERYRQLGMDIRDLGCCKVISHPVWGTYCFIGTIFTDAPVTHPLVRAVNSMHLTHD